MNDQKKRNWKYFNLIIPNSKLYFTFIVIMYVWYVDVVSGRGERGMPLIDIKNYYINSSVTIVDVESATKYP